MRPTTLSGGWLVPLSIAATRSSVGSTIGRKSVQRFSRNSFSRFSSLSGGSSRGVVRSNVAPARSASSSGRVRPSITLLHEGPAGDRIGALDIGAQLRRRAADHRLRHECLPQRRHAAQPRRGFGDALEDMGVHGDARDAVLGFQQCGQPDDRRATGASKTDAENRRRLLPQQSWRACPRRRPSFRAA